MAEVLDDKIKQPSSGTGFTNLQRVLGANQSNRLGSTIGGGVSNVIGKANTNLNQAQNQFGQQSQQGTVGTEQDKQYANNVLKDPVQAQQSDVDKFSRFREGYKGPQGLQSDTLQGQQQDLQSLGNLTQNTGGRQALLQRFVGSPQYNQGQQRLDTMLLGQPGSNNLNQLRRQTMGANQNINQAYDTAQNQANLLKAQSNQFGTDVQNQITGAQTQEEQDLQGRADQYTQQQQALHDMFQNLLTPQKAVATPSGGQVGIGLANQVTGASPIDQAQYDQAMQAYGRAGNNTLMDQQLYGAPAVEGFDPSSIVGNVNAYTKQQAATDADKAKYLALSKLGGMTPGASSLFQDSTQTGGYDPLAFLNQQNLSKYENLGKQNYDKAAGVIHSGEEYMGDINKVKDIARQQADLLNQGYNQMRQSPSYGNGGQSNNSSTYLSPEQQAQLSALGQQRSDLVNKQSLVMLPYGQQLANYIPSSEGATPDYQSRFDQAVATGLGNAQTSIAQQKPITERYAPTTIGESLKKLLAKKDQYGNTVQG